MQELFTWIDWYWKDSFENGLENAVDFIIIIQLVVGLFNP